MSEPNLGNLKKLEAFATLQATKAMKEQVVIGKENNNVLKSLAQVMASVSQGFTSLLGSIGAMNNIMAKSAQRYARTMDDYTRGLIDHRTLMSKTSELNISRRKALSTAFNTGRKEIADFVSEMTGAKSALTDPRLALNEMLKKITKGRNGAKDAKSKTGRGTGDISNNPVQAMVKNMGENLKNSFKGALDLYKNVTGQQAKSLKINNGVKRTGKVIGKQVKKTTKEYGKMSWEMAAVNLTMGPFLEFLQSFMAPFQSLGTMMGAMGSILSTAFVPGIIEVNENFAKAIPLMWKVADSLTEVLSGFIVNGTAIGLLSQFLGKLAGKADKTEEAIRNLKNQMEKATVKVGKFRLAIYNGISSINWKPMMSGMASAMKSAAKTAIDLIEWGGAFAKLTEEEGGILPALKVVIDGIDWAAAFENVPLMMVTGLLKWFISDDADSWDLSDVAFWFVNKIAKGITDESMDFTGIAQNILNGIKVSLVKNKLNLSVADVIGVIV